MRKYSQGVVSVFQFSWLVFATSSLSNKSPKFTACAGQPEGLQAKPCRYTTEMGLLQLNGLGTRMKKWNEKWNFSQIPEISSIFRIFLALFLKIFRTFVISWNFSWNSDKISSKFSRKITKFIDFCWNENENENENVSFRQNFGRVFSWNFEVWAVQRNINLVDLEKSWKMRLLSLS